MSKKTKSKALDSESSTAVSHATRVQTVMDSNLSGADFFHYIRSSIVGWRV